MFLLCSCFYLLSIPFICSHLIFQHRAGVLTAFLMLKNITVPIIEIANPKAIIDIAKYSKVFLLIRLSA